MSTVILNFFTMILSYSALGVGPYLMLCPRVLDAPAYAVVFAPTLGIASSMVIGMYLLLYGLPIAAAIPVSAAASAALIIVILVTRIATGHHDGTISLTRILRRRSGFSTCMVMLLMSAGAAIPLIQCLGKEGAFLPVRLGIDGVLYSTMAQSAGEAWDSLTGIARDGWLIHLRWGYPIFLANNMTLCAAQHPFVIVPASLGLVHALLAGAGLIFFRRTCHLRLALALAAAMLLSVNCLLLNVLLEGQWAHALAMPLLVLCMTILHAYRLSSMWIGKAQLGKMIGLAALLFSCLLVTYSEILPLIMLLVFLIACGDAVRRRAKTAVETLGFSGAILACGCIVALPFSVRTLDHLSHRDLAPTRYWQPPWGDPAQIAALANPGYWQPRWAMPCEMLGLANSYADFSKWCPPETSPIRLRRSGVEIFLRTALSAAALIVIFLGLRALRADLAFWIAPIAIVAIGFAKYKWLPVPRGNNYTYMKLCACMIPFLSAPFAVGLTRIPDAIRHRRLPYLKWLAAGGSCLLIMAASFGYLDEFRANTVRFGRQYLALTQPPISRILSDSYLYLPRERGRIAERWSKRDRTMEFYYLPFLADRTLIDQATGDGLDRSIVAEDRKKPICVFYNKRELGMEPMTEAPPGMTIAYQDDSWLFLDTQKTIDDIAPHRPLAASDFTQLWALLDRTVSMP